jgi:hypothetical protein
LPELRVAEDLALARGESVISLDVGIVRMHEVVAATVALEGDGEPVARQKVPQELRAVLVVDAFQAGRVDAHEL